MGPKDFHVVCMCELTVVHVGPFLPVAIACICIVYGMCFASRYGVARL
jgi:hypothetical protein